MQLPLFPLNTVLFPGGPLPLQIFEPRYLELVKQSLKNDRPFGVCLIREGRETGEPATPYDHGTTARIVDWNQLSNGLLGISTVGEDRFIVRSHDVDENNLIIGDIAFLEEPESTAQPDGFDHMVSLLKLGLNQHRELYAQIEAQWEDTDWVTWRLAEVMISDNHLKLELLQTLDGQTRMAMVQAAIRKHASGA